MRVFATLLIAAALTVSLPGCALFNSVQTGTPLNQAQVQQDLAVASAALRDLGCFAAAGAVAAAPIVAVASDAQGSKVLTAVGASGAAICPPIPAPASIQSAPGTTLGAVVVTAAPAVTPPVVTPPAIAPPAS